MASMLSSRPCGFRLQPEENGCRYQRSRQGIRSQTHPAPDKPQSQYSPWPVHKWKKQYMAHPFLCPFTTGMWESWEYMETAIMQE